MCDKSNCLTEGQVKILERLFSITAEQQCMLRELNRATNDLGNRKRITSFTEAAYHRLSIRLFFL